MGNQDLLQEIDKILRFNERVLRYQTVKINKKLDIETLREKEPQEATQATLPSSETEKVIGPTDSSGSAQEDIVA